MKQVTLSVIVFLSFMLGTVSAQEELVNRQSGYEPLPETFSLGDKTFAFGDKNIIRTKPSRQAETQAMLPIGQELSIVAVDTNMTTVDGRTAAWHKVRWTDAKGNQEGWIWGGLLALSAQKAGNNLCLIGCVKGNIATDYNTYNYELRIVSNGSLVAKHTFQNLRIGEAQSYMFEVADARGLKSIDNVVHFSWVQAMCGGSQSDYYLLWTDAELQSLPVLHTSSEMGLGEVESYIFPDDFEGLGASLPIIYVIDDTAGNCILYCRETSDGDDNGGDVTIKIRKMVYENKKWVMHK